MNKYEISIIDNEGKTTVQIVEAESAADAVFICEFENNQCLSSGKDCKFYPDKRIIGIRAVK